MWSPLAGTNSFQTHLKTSGKEESTGNYDQRRGSLREQGTACQSNRNLRLQQAALEYQLEIRKCGAIRKSQLPRSRPRWCFAFGHDQPAWNTSERFSRPADFHLCESGGGAALRGLEKGERLPCCCLCLAPLWPSELFIFSCCQFLLLCHHLLNLNLNLILTPSGLNYPLSTVGTVTWAHKTALISSKIRKRTFRTKKMF